MKYSSIFVSCLSLCLILLANTSFAGSGKVTFGAYTAGQGCSGSGICQTGAATGAIVAFTYYENPDTSGGSFTKLTMLVNYEQATMNGFIGSRQGGYYKFTGGYTFDHPGDRELGVPYDYSIPDGYSCHYEPVDMNGRIRLIVTQFKPNKG
jgi:hypothetical protein